jgi:hypothetical protein
LVNCLGIGVQDVSFNERRAGVLAPLERDPLARNSDSCDRAARAPSRDAAHASNEWVEEGIDVAVRLAPKAKAYYWRTQAGAELDLLLLLNGRRIGIEIKRSPSSCM